MNDTRENKSSSIEPVVPSQGEKLAGVLEEDPISGEVSAMPSRLSDLHAALLKKFNQSGDPVLKDAAEQIRALRRQVFEHEIRNGQLRELLLTRPGAPEKSEEEKALDRPWQTHGHGHYEYIETICDAYESGMGDGLTAKPLMNPYGRDNPDQGTAFEIGHVEGMQRRQSGAAGSTVNG